MMTRLIGTRQVTRHLPGKYYLVGVTWVTPIRRDEEGWDLELTFSHRLKSVQRHSVESRLQFANPKVTFTWVTPDCVRVAFRKGFPGMFSFLLPL